MRYQNIPEEEIKNKVTQDYFKQFDCTKILGKIDFAVKAAPLFRRAVKLLCNSLVYNLLA